MTGSAHLAASTPISRLNLRLLLVLLCVFAALGASPLQAAPVVMVLSPNGGEQIDSLTEYTISWTWNDVVITETYVLLSTDGGVSYPDTVAVLVDETSYQWMVPNLDEPDCRIKVICYDAEPSEGSDESDADFQIIPEIPVVTVLDPNGGEEIDALTDYTISWTWGDNLGVTETYVLLSTDSGASYPDTVASLVDETSYLWAVPDIDEPDCRIKVVCHDAEANEGSDESDADFRIIPHDGEPPSVTVLAPNGGEKIIAQTEYTISWTSSDNVGVTETYVLLSTDSGVSYPDTVATLVDETSYQWTTPDIDQPDCRIRVVCYDAEANQGSDESDANFKITPDDEAPVVTVLAPNGGEQLDAMTKYTISWTSSDNVAVAETIVLLSIDGGVSYPDTVASLTNETSYQWIVPDIDEPDCRIKIVCYDAELNEGSDESDADFQIRPFDSEPPSVTVIAPNGGEQIDALTEYMISWTSSDNVAVTETYVLLSTDSGVSYPDTVVTLVDETSYLWTVPDIDEPDCRIKVVCYDAELNEGSDESDADFRIIPHDGEPPMVTVVDPNGGEEIDALTEYTISWTSSDSVGVTETHVLLSTDSGVSYPDTVATLVDETSYLWTVPDIDEPDCRIKVVCYDAELNEGSDESDADFRIIPHDGEPPAVTVLDPNGGEHIDALTQYTIFWTSSDSVGVTETYVLLSTDSGVSYPDTVATLVDETSYLWTVPDIDEPGCRIKVVCYDAELNEGFDESDADFRIIPHDDEPPVVTVVDPNGGEEIIAQTEYTITWTSSDNVAVTETHVLLSTDSGVSYPDTVATLVDETSYLWAVPDIDEPDCRIKVVCYDAESNEGSDESDADFTIAPDQEAPSVTVSAPNGGEQIDALTEYMISWTSSDNVAVTETYVLLSTDSGVSYPDTVVTLVDETSYLWTVPDIDEPDCRIKVVCYDSELNEGSDESDADFRIIPHDDEPPTVTVVDPNGGEQIDALTEYMISWTSSDNVDVTETYVLLSTDSGASYPDTVATLVDETSYLWTVPDIDEPNCRIKVVCYDAELNEGSDESDADFRIIPHDGEPPAVTVLDPNGGEQIDALTQYTISWTSSDSVGVTQTYVLLSTDSGVSYPDTVATLVDETSYLWIVPDIDEPDCRVKVVCYDSELNEGSDESDADFRIIPHDDEPPAVTVVDPNGGEEIIAQTQYTISWTSSDSVGVTATYVLLSTDSGISYPDTVATLVDETSYLWTVPDIDEPDCRIKVVCYDAELNEGFDESDADFTIAPDQEAPSVTVSAPNGGEQIDALTEYMISWTSSDNVAVTETHVLLSTDSGVSYPDTVATLVDETSYLWTVPDIDEPDCRIKVVCYDSELNEGSDESDADFRIIPHDGEPPMVTVVDPNGGEEIDALTEYTISWTSSDSVGVTETSVLLSTDSGVSYPDSVATLVDETSYLWTVPDIDEPDCRIKVVCYDAELNQGFDESDADFRIIPHDGEPPAVTVLDPNGGEQIDALTQYMISWTSSDSVGVTETYVLLSTDSGVSYPDTVATLVDETSYLWTVPDIDEPDCRIKVVCYDAELNEGSDESDADFRIIPHDDEPPVVTVVDPNGGEEIIAQTQYTISWTSSDSVGVTQTYVLLSTDSGVSYPDTVATLVDETSYLWTVADIDEPDCRIKVVCYDAESNEGSDESDADFTIAPDQEAPSVTVSAPNGGEEIDALTEYTISWTSSDNVAVTETYVLLSTDSGVSYPDTVATLVDETSYLWTVPDIDEPDCRIKVVCYDSELNEGSDESDADFRIIPHDDEPPTVTVLDPNGGEEIDALTEYTISWTSSDSVGVTQTYVLLSTDSGVSYPDTVATLVDETSYLWTVPDIDEPDCRIKVVCYDAELNQGSDESDADFRIIPHDGEPPAVTVVAPNGGEEIDALTEYTISWTSSDIVGVTETYVLFSTDSGVSYPDTVATLVDETSYLWTVPDIDEPDCRIKVVCYDAELNEGSDESDADFRIIPHDDEPPVVTVVDPNGGEEIIAQTQYTISWTSSDSVGVTATYVLLSTDSGITYPDTVASLADETSFLWMVPDIDEPDCRIKVVCYDAESNEGSDESDADFTIAPDQEAPSVTVSAPNGGEEIIAQTEYTITWTSSDNVAVTETYVLLSTDSGVSYPDTVATLVDETSYLWMVPDIDEPDCRIKVVCYDAELNEGFDESDADFTIAPDQEPPSVTVVAPNGGEEIDALTEYAISWTSSDNVGVTETYVLLSTDSGVSYPDTVATLVDETSYLWTVPDIDEPDCRIKVICYDAELNEGSDESDADFRIIPHDGEPPTVTVVDPNGGEEIDALTEYTISWTSSDSVGVAETYVLLSTDSGVSYPDTVATLVDETSYLWTVPDIDEPDCRIKVVCYDAELNEGFDESDADFRIIPHDDEPPVVTVVDPNGGEEIIAQTEYTITWTSSDNVAVTETYVLLSTDSGVSYPDTVATLVDETSYLWMVPDIDEPDCRIKVVCYDAELNEGFDESDADFTIAPDQEPPSVTVVAPNGGEQIDALTEYTISWTSSDNVDVTETYVLLSTDSGVSYPDTVVTLVDETSYLWTVPDIDEPDCRIKVVCYDAESNEGSDESDADFRIIPHDDEPPVVTVVDPNGGEEVIAQTEYTILWTSNDNVAVTETYVLLSTDSGVTYPDTVATLVDEMSYEWMVPDIDEPDCRIRVVCYDAEANEGSDESDTDFIIAPDHEAPAVTVVAPNGGENIIAQTEYTVSWTSNDNVGVTETYVLLSTDSGVSYPDTVATLVDETSYLWTVPDIDEPDCRIKVVCYDAELNEGSDESDADFTIAPDQEPPSVTVVAPNGGEEIIAQTEYTISWSSGDNVAVTQTYVLLSTDSGISYPDTVATLADETSYLWTVPDIDEPDCRIKVVCYDAESNEGSDESDADFTIAPDQEPPSVTVVAPNGGEEIIAQTEYTISWSSSDNVAVTQTYVLLSTDSGVSYPDTVATLVDETSYLWMVPDIDEPDCRVKVVCYDAESNEGSDESDADFTIAPDQEPPSVAVVAPNGGEEIIAQTEYTISWSSSDNVAVTQTYVLLSTDSGTSYPDTVATLADETSYLWTVPDIDEPDCRVKVVCYDAELNEGSDESDADFTIAPDQEAPSVTVVTPNGGEEIIAETEYTISWTSSDNVAVTQTYVLLSTDSGTSYPDTVATLVDETSYLWTVPDIDEPDCRIKVVCYDAELNEGFDQSDADFQINPAPYLIRPDGTGDFTTIQEAINAASDSGTIELTNGTFVGDGNRDLDFLGKAIVVRSKSGDPDSCIIDCQATPDDPHQGFQFRSGEGSDSVLEGITIANGSQSRDGTEGGGVRCAAASSPTLRNLIISGNQATNGAGISCSDSASPAIASVTFVGNSATGDGGGIFIIDGASPSLFDVTFLQNSAENGGGLFAELSTPTMDQAIFEDNSANEGGGIYLRKIDTSFSNVTLERNTAVNGGGIACDSSEAVVVFSLSQSRVSENSATIYGGGILSASNGSLHLTDVLLQNNTAGQHGGAVMSFAIAPDTSSMVLDTVTLEDNSSGYAGGAISTDRTHSTLTSVDFLRNTSNRGGALACYGSTISAEYATFVADSANFGGAIYGSIGAEYSISSATFHANAGFEEGGGIFLNISSSMTAQNSIIAFSSEGEAVGCGNGSSATLSCCDLYGNSAGDWVGCISDQADTDGNISLDPLFCNAEAGDLTLSSNSPCLEANNDCGVLIGAHSIGCGSSSTPGDGVASGSRALSIPFPNPVTSTFTYTIRLQRGSKVRVRVYNVRGELVRSLVDESLPSGLNSLVWTPQSTDGRRLPSGVYYIVLDTPGARETRQFVLTR